MDEEDFLNVESATYGKDKWVVVGALNNSSLLHYPAEYSSDGINWRAADWTPDSLTALDFRDVDFLDVTYNPDNDEFYAVGTTNDGPQTIFGKSSDGITWEVVYAPFDIYTRGIAYGNGKYVCVGSSGTEKFGYSPDGINWIAATPNWLNNERFYKVAFGNGRFVAVSESNSNSGQAAAAYSDDGGRTWFKSNLQAGEWHNITFGDGKFVAVNEEAVDGSTAARPKTEHHFAVSTNGIDWEYSSLNDSTGQRIPGRRWLDIAYGNGYFIAVGNNAVLFLPPGRTNEASCAYSSDGLHWQAALNIDYYCTAIGSSNTNDGSQSFLACADQITPNSLNKYLCQPETVIYFDSDPSFEKIKKNDILEQVALDGDTEGKPGRVIDVNIEGKYIVTSGETYFTSTYALETSQRDSFFQTLMPGNRFKIIRKSGNLQVNLLDTNGNLPGRKIYDLDGNDITSQASNNIFTTSSLPGIYLETTDAPASGDGLFRNGDGEWEFEYADTHKIINFVRMFYACRNFNAPVNFNLDAAENVGAMFEYAEKFNDPSINFWDTSNIYDFAFMFKNCALLNQPLSNWDTKLAVGGSSMNATFFETANLFGGVLQRWCVPSISSEPPNFSGGSSELRTDNKPKWGTCVLDRQSDQPLTEAEAVEVRRWTDGYFIKQETTFANTNIVRTGWGWFYSSDASMIIGGVLSGDEPKVGANLPGRDGYYTILRESWSNDTSTQKALIVTHYDDPP